MLTLQGLDLVVHATEAGVDPPVHPPEGGVVERDLLLDRLDGALGVAQPFEGRWNVGVDAGAYPTQDGGPQAGRLLYPDYSDRLVGDGGFDAHQQTVLGAASDSVDSPELVYTRVVEEWFERVAGIVGQSLKDGPEDGSALDVRTEADERPPRCWVVVWRVRKAQVRQEEGAEGPRRDLLGLGDQGVVVYPAKNLSQPFDTGARGVLAAEDVVLASHVGSLSVTLTPDLGVCERALERQEDRLCGTERVEHRALLRDADGQGAADVIVAAGRDAGALWQPCGGRGVSGYGSEERAAASEGGEEIRGDTHLLEQLLGPPQPVEVEG